MDDSMLTQASLNLENGSEGATETYKQCRFCGARMSWDAVFCGNCGKREVQDTDEKDIAGIPGPEEKDPAETSDTLNDVSPETGYIPDAEDDARIEDISSMFSRILGDSDDPGPEPDCSPEPSVSRVCSRCGAALSEDAVFCLKCGSKVTPDEDENGISLQEEESFSGSVPEDACGDDSAPEIIGPISDTAENGKTCEYCGADISGDTEFCHCCRVRIHPEDHGSETGSVPEAVPVAVPVSVPRKETRICEYCGEDITFDSGFCHTCHAKIPADREDSSVMRNEVPAEPSVLKPQKTCEYCGADISGDVGFCHCCFAKIESVPEIQSEVSEEGFDLFGKETDVGNPGIGVVTGLSHTYDDIGDQSEYTTDENKEEVSVSEPTEQPDIYPDSSPATDNDILQPRTCRFCGAVMGPEAGFCAKCGKRDEPESQEPEAAPEEEKEAAEPKICRFCGASMSPEAEFCAKCGKRDEPEVPETEAAPAEEKNTVEPKTCRFCGAAMAPESEFCAKCGKRDEPEVPESEAAPEEEKNTVEPKICRFCGAAMAPEAEFCSKCGKKEETGSSESIPEQETEPVQRRFCKYCGAPLNPGAKFCGKCGKKPDSGINAQSPSPVNLTEDTAPVPTVRSVCAYCGSPMSPGAKFCGKCGRKPEPEFVPAAAAASVPQPRKFCKFCGAPVSTTTRFCGKCGHRLLI